MLRHARAWTHPWTAAVIPILIHARSLCNLAGFAPRGVSLPTPPAAQRQLHLKQQQQRGWSAPGGSSWSNAWFGFAAAAAAAAGFAPQAAAHAPHDSQPDSFWQAAVSSAQLALSEAFAEVLQDWDRTAAQRNTSSSSTSSSSSSASGRPVQPSVKVEGGRFLSVSIPLLPGADTARLLRVIDSGLDGLARSSTSSSQSQTTTTMGASRVAQFDLDRTIRLPPQPTDHHQPGRGKQQQQQQPAAAPKPFSRGTTSGSTRQHLSVQVVVPLQQPSPHDSSCATGSCSRSDSSSSAGGYVSVVKPGAAFTADELGLLARLVAAANTPSSSTLGSSSPLQGFGPSSPFDSPLGRVFGDLMRQLQSDLFAEPRQQDAPDWQDLAGRWQGFLGGLGEQLPGDWQQQLQQQLEQQLAELAPPEVITWLHQLDEQQQQQQQQQEEPQQLQLPHGHPPSSSSSSAGTSPSPQLPAPEPLLPWQQPAAQSAVRQLQQLGAQVFLPPLSALVDAAADGGKVDDDNGGWGVLAGYEEQKAALEDCLLLPLKHPEVFDAITARTRRTAHAGSSRPRAVLFEGPPGTGKTSCARVLSRRAMLPLVYVPLEALASKWYGESEQNLAKVFKACEGLGGAIIFLDELDSLATSRDRSDMHEASRRLLGVLLREIDGFENSIVAAGPAASSASSASNASSSSSSASASASSSSASRRSVLIGATNRRQDLDAALLSRFDLSIHFGLPDAACRAAIMGQYAAQLEPQALAALAAATPGFSGRDLRDVAEQAERAVAAATIRGEVPPGGLPGLENYLAAVRQRQRGAGRGPAVAAARD